ncbi:TetR/AcrR family transcriptional regulator [Halalkalibacter nanhaiisediminis]|uniref:TetR family transcriptional regulator n=1 Tax=Halalkalibacter nanhaiisediminis TaxID=688079 RepID=A0A562QM85_9BACI|nr:TetR/AcrR family transcriptional regulator [Halalkalibacter nanhaiisediminis]TWI57857.1 TetR family transcriptional regulator [Halalkalibacter nanhaiisediminis]
MTIHKIKKVSLILFADKGYNGASLSDIAAGVGIKKPSIYAHFSGKDDLYMAVFEEVFHLYIERMKDIKNELTFEPLDKRLYLYLLRLSAFIAKHQAEMMMYKRAIVFPPEQLKEIVSNRHQQVKKLQDEILEDIFLELCKAEIVDHKQQSELITSFHCILNGSIVQQLLDQNDNLEKRVNSIWKIYWNGLLSLKKTALH